jgi:hypothetical protein
MEKAEEGDNGDPTQQTQPFDEDGASQRAAQAQTTSQTEE